MSWKIFLWTIGIILVLGLVDKTFTVESFQNNPVQSFMDSVKVIFEKISDMKTETNETDDTTNLTNYGKPDCVTNSDCNVISSCEGNKCSCSQGECFG